MERALRTCGVLIAAAGVTLAAADPAYVGKWKFNPAKSQLTGDTLTIDKSADGMLTFDSQGFRYSFKDDGKPYPTPDGASVTWKPVSADAWDIAVTANDKPIVAYRATIKGDTMNLAGKMYRQDGTTGDLAVTYKRVSGGPGLAGKWMSTEVKPPVMNLTIAVLAPDGVTVSDDSGAVMQGQFDGKDMPTLGRLQGSKITTAFKKTGQDGFEVTTKVDGKAMSVERYAVSADGKTLTISGTPANAPTETYKVVLDRQ